MSEGKPEQGASKTRSGPSSGSFKVARVEVQELAALAGPELFGTPGLDLMSDELLIDRVLLGESENFDVLMRRTAARLYRTARGLTAHAPTAEEVVQAAFVRAYECLPSFDRRLRLGDWLNRIAIHGALASMALASERSTAGPPRRRQLELVRQLEDAVDELPEVFRVAFTLCALDQTPSEDAAQALGISAETVRVRSFRGRLLVRRRLGARFDDVESRAFGLDLGTAHAVMQRVRERLGLA